MQAITISNDATLFADRNEGTVQLWDGRTGQAVGVPLEHADTVRSTAFSPDGTRVVTASDDTTARIWDTTTGQPVSAPLTHGGAVTSARFSADGTRVVTASDDSRARVWDVPVGTSSDVAMIAEFAEATSGYALNDAGDLVAVKDARIFSLLPRVSNAARGKPTVASILRWVFDDPWDRTISPMSTISVTGYILERVKQCTNEARSEAESHFLSHPLLLRIDELCHGGVRTTATK